MRAVWTGAVSFGLVHLPVRLYTAAERGGVSFRQLHTRCHGPIRYRKWCPRCDMEVPPDELTRGYEYERDRFVIVDDEDLEAIPLTTVRTLEILQFTEAGEVHPIHYHRPYYVGPGDHGQRAYRLLHEAMSTMNRNAVARLVLRRREHLALLRPHQEAFLLMLVRYPATLRTVQSVPGLETTHVEVESRELQLAQELIDRLTADFAPEQFQDRYEVAVRQLVEARLTGQEIVAAPQPQPQVGDLIDALEESLAVAARNGSAGPTP